MRLSVERIAFAEPGDVIELSAEDGRQVAAIRMHPVKLIVPRAVG
jgi:hypothetical protein